MNTMLSDLSSGLSGDTGSRSKTSMPAPAMRSVDNAGCKAFSSTIGPRAIDEIRGLLHPRELARANQLAGLVAERAIDTEKIGFAEQRIRLTTFTPSGATNS